MKDYQQFNESQAFNQMLPVLQELESHLKEQNISLDDFLSNALEVRVRDEFKEFIDPITAVAGGYALKKGFDKLGGWQGIKNLAGAGMQGLRQTGANLAAAYQGNRLAQDRQAARDLAAKTGGTVTLPKIDPNDPKTVNTWTDSIKDSAEMLMSHASGMVNQDPEVRRQAGIIAQAAANIRRRTQQLATL